MISAQYKKLFIISLAIIIAATCLLAGCSGGNTDKADAKSDKKTEDNQVAKEKSVVEITMKDGGKIDIELEPTAAPKTVENFLKLVNAGFYDGLTFHRIIPDFMIQGGDPKGDGTGGSEETIPGEFNSNGYKDNPISHVRGVISMARSSDPNSASSQFFITNADSEFLNGEYAAFGRVTEGMDVVDKISAVKTGANDAPATPVVIESIKQIK
jgi:peptidyl-prolyl cis-trans isomerase B (cyclophilin B)